jgi:hypothetical protein
VHFPPSRFFTSRFTFGGTAARRFSCCARRRSSAAVSTCSSVAPGLTCDWPAFALASNFTNSGETVTCIRVSLGVSGSTSVRVGASSTIERESSFTFSCSGAVADAADTAATRTWAPVTTVLRGTSSTGRISTATCSASCRDRWKNRGSTSYRFASVVTRASTITVVRHNRPSRSGSTISGNRMTSRVATWR